MVARLISIQVLSALLSVVFFSNPTFAAFVTSLDGGVQFDYLRWNTSGPNKEPNVLSELTFKAVSPMGRLNMAWYSEERPLWLEVQYGFGKVVDGSVKDDDFAFDDRQGLFSRSKHDSNDHNVQTGRARVGYWRFGNERFSVFPNLGFQWQFARLKIEGGRQEVPDIDIDFSDLNSVYSAQWYAFSIGSIVQYAVERIPILLTADANAFPYAYYKGRASWNLRTDFEQDPSFEQHVDGFGGSLELQAQWKFYQDWQTGIGWRGQYFYAEDGTTKFFLSDGSREKIRLRRVKHFTNFIFLNLSYHW